MLKFFDHHFEECLGGIILAIMTGIAFVNVIVRYLSQFSFAWSEEITTNLFVWIVLLGTACAFRDNSNLCVSLFYDRFKPNVRKLLYLCSCIICTLFFGVLCYTGCLEVIDEIDLERVSDSLEIPFWLYSQAVPVFSLLIIFRIWQRFYRDLRDKNF